MGSMAVPRPLLLALVGVLLLGATFVASRNGRESAEDAPAPAAQQERAAGPKKQEASPRAEKPAEKRAEPSRAKESSRRGNGLATPAAVARAIGDRRIVVLFFHQRGGLDDRVTAAAVDSVRSRTRAAVFSDRIDNIDRYAPIVSETGISQAPAVLLIDHDGNARVFEGYIDAESLAQEIADVR
jgi:pyruvate/2-oxoglutarate dehydrogenase complex dihydrolipoamide acyltransferase (E2) component